MSVIKSCVSSIVCHQSAGHCRVLYPAMACVVYQTESNFRTGLRGGSRILERGGGGVGCG